jgi:endonuclease YncB( thermonuclease family)
MKRKQKDIIALVALILALFILNYPVLEQATNNLLNTLESAHVERVIDGDTIEVAEYNETVRLLGINTPERGEWFYQEAKDYLGELVFNKTVNLKFTKERYDKYNRVLAYIFLDNTNINVEMVRQGYANYYFYDGRDEYSNALEAAWSECINDNVNLCQASVNQCAQCIGINTNSIINNCAFSCDINGWEIKTEGREKFEFNGTLASGQTAEFNLDTTNSGGSLFLRDGEHGLVGWI